jgi:17beta-estradiol 17-dehydrogenase / very-long-chain 3-oxoacyl-CoA reductase
MKDNVHVEHLNVFFVCTAMSKIRKPTWTIPDPQTFVASVLQNAGASTHSTPYYVHSIIEWFYDHYTTEEYILREVVKLHTDIRKRAIAKKKRLNEAAN